MEIQRLTERDYADFLLFHAKAYPKHLNVKERFQFQFLENPLLQDKTKTHIFLARDKKNNILGQYGVNPQEYSLRGINQIGFCGCDLFVDESARKYGAGGFLSMKAIKSCTPHFSIGVSAEAKPILLSLQMKKIGEVYRYLWIRKWLNPKRTAKMIIAALRQKEAVSSVGNPQKSNPPLPKQKIFPQSISSEDYCFSLMDKKTLEQWSKNKWPIEKSSNNEPQNYDAHDLLMFTRNSAFLQWRFFTIPGYYVYQFNSNYFAITPVRWKSLNLLAIVDIQVDLFNKSTNSLINAMITAAKKITEEYQYDGIITLSSHAALDNRLRRHFFMRLGSPFDFYTNVLAVSNNNANFFTPERIKKREATHIAMVDSDLEFSFWDENVFKRVQTGDIAHFVD